MTTNSNADEWFNHFYNHPTSAAPPPLSNTTTTTNNYSSLIGMGDHRPISATTTPGPVAQGARVSRKRSRTSRKNPTTLLNTDTANFRAMVQRYTGGNASTYSPSETASPAGFNLIGSGGFQMRDLNQIHLHQQLLLQNHGGGALATGDIGGSSARSRVEEEGFSSLSHLYSSDMGGNGGGGGFMY